jgi:hypothetical protein
MLDEEVVEALLDCDIPGFAKDARADLFSPAT